MITGAQPPARDVSGAPSTAIEAYFEVGAKRTFAGAIEWPGWCRSGRDEASALAALHDYAPRYAKVLAQTKLDFALDDAPIDFDIVERLKGDATTDFGAPGQAPSSDDRPVTDADGGRLRAILEACWVALDRAVADAMGVDLAKGPRGGGRELDGIVDHVIDAEGGYLSRLGWKVPPGPRDRLDRLTRTRTAALEAFDAAAHGKVEREGPRGGRRITARYFVRRTAWHALDHAWEIEDRATG
ncbi:MAG: hypothetical protein ACRDF7_00710 [Candidatus Limnocylindrales bacterium]